MSVSKLPLLEICVVTGLVVRDDVAGTRTHVVHFHDAGRDKIIELAIPQKPELQVRFIPAQPVQVLWHPCVTLGGLRQASPNQVAPGVVKTLAYERSSQWAAHWGYNFGSSEMSRHFDAPFERIFGQYEEALLAAVLLRNGPYRSGGAACHYVLASTGEKIELNLTRW